MNNDIQEKKLIEILEDLVLNNTDDKNPPKVYIKQAFKYYVAEYFICIKDSVNEKQGLPKDAIEEGKKYLISVFRKCDFNEHQRSYEWYENVFNETVYEILNLTSYTHKGKDTVEQSKTELVVNGDAYVNEGGLYVPKGLKS